MLLKGNF